jgi:hypothetical protein
VTIVPGCDKRPLAGRADPATDPRPGLPPATPAACNPALPTLTRIFRPHTIENTVSGDKNSVANKPFRYHKRAKNKTNIFVYSI